MGRDLANTFLAAHEVYVQADEILGFELSTLCFSGPEDALNETINTQPAVLTTGVRHLARLTN